MIAIIFGPYPKNYCNHKWSTPINIGCQLNHEFDACAYVPVRLMKNNLLFQRRQNEAYLASYSHAMLHNMAPMRFPYPYVNTCLHFVPDRRFATLDNPIRTSSSYSSSTSVVSTPEIDDVTKVGDKVAKTQSAYFFISSTYPTIHCQS